MSKHKLFSVTIHDCKIETFAVGGAGGSGKDTSNTGVRITHVPSGAQGVGKDTRSQHKNKQDAFRRMAQSREFRSWAKRRANELQTGKSVADMVEIQMEPDKLKIEYRTPNGWEVIPAEKIIE